MADARISEVSQLSGTPAGVLPRLRAATKIHHETLERDLNIVDGLCQVSGYVTLLRKFLGFCRPWEREVSELVDPLVPDYGARRRKETALRKDLEYFGEDPDAAPDCVTRPIFDTAARAMGSLYVMEGSTLGGQYLTRLFSERFRVEPGAGCSYFSGYGPETGSMWKSFGGSLERFADQENAVEIIAGAQETFVCLHQWLCRPI